MAVFYGDYARADTNTFDYLKPSMIKLNAIKADIDGNPLSYFIPLIRQHVNYKKLTKSNFSDEPYNYYNGYKLIPYKPHSKNFADGVFDVQEPVEHMQTITAKIELYLKKMLELCKANNIDFVLYKSPTSSGHTYARSNALKAFCEKFDIDFIEYNEKYRELDYTPNLDSYDGAHPNINGAEKITMYMGKYLTDTFNLPDYRNDPHYADWHNDSLYFFQEKQKHLVQSETDINKYLGYFNDPNYIVFISAKGEAFVKIDEISQQLKALGIIQILNAKDQDGYIGIIESNNVIYENVQKKALEYDSGIDNLDVKIVSQGGEKADASIIIDGEEFSVNGRGLNIVVYDKLMKEVVDGIVFDTYDQLQCFRE